MIKKRILNLLFISLVISVNIAGAVESEFCNVAEAAIAKSSEIRGLDIKKDVPCKVHSKAQIKDYLLKTIDTKIPAHKFEMEEYVFKALGIIPEEFDYKHGLVDLYVSQIGGYYDPERDYYVMAAWMPAMLQATIAVHEMTHALQDQYFDLEAFVDHKLENSDELIARSALVEGDATAVMTDYNRVMMGQPKIEKEKDVNSIMMGNVMGASFMATMGDVPESLKAIILFPYISGLRFAHVLLKKGSYQEIDRAFKQPPLSTEEILHPEKYMQKDFKVYTDEELFLDGMKDKYKLVYKDTLGEFGISAMLSMYTANKSKVARAAAGWGGDRVAVFEEVTTAKKSLVWKTNWDTEKDAEEFYQLYKNGLRDKYKNGFTESSESLAKISTENKEIDLSRDGALVVFYSR